MIHIGKSDLHIIKPASRAYVLLKQIPNTPVENDYVLLYCDYFQFEGTVDVTGKPAPEDPAQWRAGDSAGRWRVGFSQLQLRITDRATYRGDSDKAGSVTVRRDRPPAKSFGATRDDQSQGDPFCYAPGLTTTRHPVHGDCVTPFPLNMDIITNDPFKAQVCHTDSPITGYSVRQVNSLTGQDCMLHSVLVEWQFMTMLMVMDPARTFHQLKHIFWNVHWDATFDRIATQTGASIKPRINTRNTRMVFGPILDGAPADARFRDLATAPSTPTSTMQVNHAANFPVTEPSRTW